GNFIGFQREHKFGKSVYTPKEQQVFKDVIASNLYDTDLSGFAYKAPKETKGAKPEKKTVDFNKLVEDAVSEKELDAIIDQADKAGQEVDFDLVSKKRETFAP